MSRLFAVARVSVGLNAAMLAFLAFVWGRNYRRLRSKHAFGLFVFAALLFAENALALYVYQFDSVLSAWFGTRVPPVAWRAMLALHLLETLALVVLTWISID